MNPLSKYTKAGCKAIRALTTLAGSYPQRWPELSELPPEEICDFLRSEGWIWNPDSGLLGRWEKSQNHEEGDPPNGEEET